MSDEQVSGTDSGSALATAQEAVSDVQAAVDGLARTGPVYRDRPCGLEQAAEDHRRAREEALAAAPIPLAVPPEDPDAPIKMPLADPDKPVSPRKAGKELSEARAKAEAAEAENAKRVAAWESTQAAGTDAGAAGEASAA